MKRFWKVAVYMIAIAIVLALVPAFTPVAQADKGYDPTSPDISGAPVLSGDGNYYYVHFYTDKDEKVISPKVDIYSYTGTDDDVTVPASLDGYQVECVLNGAFNKSSVEVEDVTVSEGIDYLGESAFFGCSKLEKISLPSTIQMISTAELKDLPKLTQLNVAPGNASYSSLDGVLYNNDGTMLLFYPPAKADANFEIPSTVTTLMDSAFEGAEYLASVSIPSSVTKIGSAGFGADGLIGGEVFIGCASLSSIAVDAANPIYYSTDGVLYAKDDADGKVLLMQYPKAKADPEFAIPDGVTTICPDAFAGTAALQTVDISASVTEFLSASSDEGIENPFNCCPKLSAITVADGNTAFAAVDNVLFSSDKTTLICYPEGRPGDSSVGNYPLSAKRIDLKQFRELQGKLDSLKKLEMTLPQAVVDSMRKNIRVSMINLLKGKSPAAAGLVADATGNYDIPDKTQSIASLAFGGTKLSIVTMPDSVGADNGKISVDAFQNAAGVSIRANSSSPAHTYAVENGIPFIALDPATGDFIFDISSGNITGYTGSDSAVTIPPTINGHKVTGIADEAFFGQEFTSVAIPDTVVSIGEDAFGMCMNLVSVKIPDSVITIGDYCFEQCWSLQNVKLPSGLDSLGQWVFSNCEALTDITLPSGIRSLGEECFSGCSSLPEINLPDSLTSIGASCFEECSSLTHISLPAGVKSLAGYTFDSCTSLVAVELPGSLRTIGDGCFAMCSSLTNIAIPKNVQIIGMLAFYGCDDLESFTVDGDNAEYTSAGGVLYDKGMTALICYPAAQSATTFTIPDGVETVCDGAFYGNCPLVTINIGADVSSIGSNAFSTTKLQEIIVDEGNQGFTNHIINGTSDGVLYTYDKVKGITGIVCYPMAKPDQEYTIPLGITSIDPAIFMGRLFETVNIPASVTSIVADEEEMISLSPFALCANLLNINVDPANPKFTSVDGVMLTKSKTSILQYPIGRTGSYAIPNTVTTIADFAFFGLRLDMVSFPASIRRLGYFSFSMDMTETFKMAVFYGNPYNTDTSYMPFEGLSFDFKVYYPISKSSAWKTFRDYKKQPYCTLMLNLQDGEANKAVVAPIRLTGPTAGTISKPDDPSRANFTFAGWYKEPSCKNAWDFSKDTVSNDITLYAKWVSAAVTDVQGVPLTYNSIKVTWTAITGVTGYEVSRSTKPDSGFKVLGTSASASYTDKTVNTGTPYYYRVRAFVKYGSTKYYGPYSDISASATASLAKPVSVKAVRLNAKNIKVSWSKVAGATKYEIREYTGSLSGPEKSFYSTSANFTDKKLTAGTTYYYVVVAYRKVGSIWVTSDASDSVSATP